MESLLSQSYYIDQKIYEDENKSIFSKLWIFAGLKTAFEKKDAYITKKIAGIPIILIKDGANIKAFVNQCLHRQMPFYTEPYGTGRLICKYHGWTYESCGKVKTIPANDRLYLFDNEELASFRLKEFSVAIVGNFIFVNLDADPMPIEQQFSMDLISHLEQISPHFSNRLIHTSIPCQYNWKLNYENVLDHNHVPYVHSKTFRPLINKKGEVDEIPIKKPDEHYLDNVHLVDASSFSAMPMNIKHWPWHDLVNRFAPSEEKNLYYNFFLYPNVNFISVGGLIFLAQQFNPISASVTEVSFTLFTANQKSRIPALPAILWGHLKGEMQVFIEDKVLLEQLQDNFYGQGISANHGAYEINLQTVKKIYLDLLGR